MEPINPPGAHEGNKTAPHIIEDSNFAVSEQMPVVEPNNSPHHMEGAMSAANAEEEQAAMAEQKRVIEALQAMQDVREENPDTSTAMVTPPEAPLPEPTSESILHAPPAKKPFLAGALTQIKDTFTQLVQGVKKLLFPQKGPKPPARTTFKNLGREGGAPAVSFKSQPSSA